MLGKFSLRYYEKVDYLPDIIPNDKGPESSVIRLKALNRCKV